MQRRLCTSVISGGTGLLSPRQRGAGERAEPRSGRHRGPLFTHRGGKMLRVVLSTMLLNHGSIAQTLSVVIGRDGAVQDMRGAPRAAPSRPPAAALLEIVELPLMFAVHPLFPNRIA